MNKSHMGRIFKITEEQYREFFEVTQHRLDEMACVGNIDNKYSIIVYGNDPGNIAHFHVVDRATRGQKFQTCIMFDSPEYFHHGNKNGTLNNKEIKQMIEFFQKPHKDGNGLTNWKYALMLWNDNNSSTKFKKLKMPDYTKLNQFI